MHSCEFCLTEYVPCPQVKKPRACSNCQKRRQRENEKAWKQKNLGLYDGKYHRDQRDERKGEVKARIEQLVRCIEVGSTILGTVFSDDSRAEFKNWLLIAVLGVGTRRANKLWCLGFAHLAASL